MAVEFDHVSNRKTIKQGDTLDQLTDALADVLLCNGGDVNAVHRHVLPTAWRLAVEHFNAECMGDSEGYEVWIAPENDAPYSLADSPLTPIPVADSTLAAGPPAV